MASRPAGQQNNAAGADAMSSAPQSNTRQSRVRRKEDAIIAAARDMFVEHGYSGTTMAMIARQAGVADGTLYTYFENKDALARGVISDFYRRLTETAQAGVDVRKTTRRRLRFLARHHLSHMMDERAIIAMLPIIANGDEDYSESEVYALNRQYVTVFDRILREGQAAGDIAVDCDGWVLRDIFFGALDYGSRTILLRSHKSGTNKLVDQMTDMILGAGTTHSSVADRLEAVAERLETIAGKTPS